MVKYTPEGIHRYVKELFMETSLTYLMVVIVSKDISRQVVPLFYGLFEERVFKLIITYKVVLINVWRM